MLKLEFNVIIEVERSGKFTKELNKVPVKVIIEGDRDATEALYATLNKSMELE